MGRVHRELQAGQSQLVGHLAANAIGYCKRLLRFRKHLNIWKETVLHHPCSILLLTTCHTLSHVSPFSICRRVVHRNSSRHTLHTHKTSTRLRYTRPLLPASSSAWPAPLWALTLNPAPLFFFFLLASGSESEATPEKRPRTDEKEGGSEEARGTPKQKNRRRCYRCQTKLELVQQELGSCRCGQYRHMSVALSHIIKGSTNFHPHTTAFNFTDSLKCVSSNKICCSVLVLLWTTKTTETADIDLQLLLLFLRLDECWCFTFEGTVRNLNH